MNKFLRYSFVALLAMIGLNVMADDQDVVFTFNTDAGIAELGIAKPEAGAGTNLKDLTTPNTLSKGTITITNVTGTGKTETRVWNASGVLDLRIYGTSTLTFTTSEKVIKKIVLAGNTVGGFTANVGSFDAGTWEGAATSVVLTATGTEKINTITVTYGDQPAIAAPTISGTTPFVGSTEVTITTSEAGAKVHYTTDGAEPTSNSLEYRAPFRVTETTTIKAITVKDGISSTVASKTFTAVPTVANVAALNALKANDTFGFTGEALVVYVNGKYAYIKDDTGSSLVFDNGKTKLANLAIGKKIAANWTGTVSIYKNLFEAVPDATLAVTDAAPVEVTYPEAAITDVKAENMNQVVVLKGVTYTAPSGNNFTISKDAVDVKGYNQFGLTIAAPTEGKTYNITGVISVYNSDVQFQPISIAETLTTYKINITNTEHGNIILDKYEAAEGEKVNVKGWDEYDEHFKMEPPTITRDDNGETVEIQGSDGGYYIIMPASNITIALNFTQYYKITATSDEHVSFHLDKVDLQKDPYSKAGKTIQIILDRIDDYYDATVTVTGADNTKIELQKNNDKEYQFDMPAQEITIAAVSTPVTWTVAGVKPLTDNTWNEKDTNADMTPNGNGPGVSTYERNNIVLEQGKNYEFKIVKNHSWDEQYPIGSNFVINVEETAQYHVKIFFNTTTKEVSYEKQKTGEAGPVEHTYGVVGTLVGSWDNDVEMTKGDDGLYTAVITGVAAGNYEFKVRADHAWDINYPASNYKLNVEQDNSTVTVTFNESNGEVKATVNGEVPVVTHTWSVIGTLVGSWDVDTDMTKGEDGLYTAKFENIAKGTYQFKVRADHDWSESYGGGDDEYGNSVVNVSSDGSTVTVTFNEEDKAVKYIVTAPTGISTAKVVDLNNAQRYNTAGQKVSKDYKGIVIVNGKKFVVK